MFQSCVSLDDGACDIDGAGETDGTVIGSFDTDGAGNND